MAPPTPDSQSAAPPATRYPTATVTANAWRGFPKSGVAEDGSSRAVRAAWVVWGGGGVPWSAGSADSSPGAWARPRARREKAFCRAPNPITAPTQPTPCSPAPLAHTQCALNLRTRRRAAASARARADSIPIPTDQEHAVGGVLGRAPSAHGGRGVAAMPAGHARQAAWTHVKRAAAARLPPHAPPPVCSADYHKHLDGDACVCDSGFHLVPSTGACGEAGG
jgi:hypothetical protein